LEKSSQKDYKKKKFDLKLRGGLRPSDAHPRNEVGGSLQQNSQKQMFSKCHPHRMMS